MKRVDLHTHTRFSDGTCGPVELVSRAQAARVELVFLTDHDTIAGYPEAAEAARAAGVDLRCGIEINTQTGDAQDSMHLLGYGLRWQAPSFQARLAEFRQRRTARVRQIVSNLRRHGIDISYEDVSSSVSETVGRPHVADALRRRGVVGSRQEAFNRFLTRGKPGFVASAGPSPAEAIALIREAGGFCSLAHPETVGGLEEIPRWIELGLEGIEVYYSTHSPSEVLEYRAVAERYGLIATGGTDFHGPGSGRDKELGVEMPDEAFARFAERLARCG